MEGSVYALLKVAPGTDVEIYKLYEAAYQVNVHKVQDGQLILGMDPRTMQQRLGSVIGRINAKLTNARVTPGKVKRTYRLVEGDA